MTDTAERVQLLSQIFQEIFKNVKQCHCSVKFFKVIFHKMCIMSLLLLNEITSKFFLILLFSFKYGKF